MNLSKTTLRQIVKTLSDFSELASKQESTRQTTNKENKQKQ